MRVLPLKAEELARHAAETPDWRVVDEHHLERVFLLPDFRTALDFVNRVGELADQEGHHPDLLLSWGRVEVRIWTQMVDGLTESDFILAAKIVRMAGGSLSA